MKKAPIFGAFVGGINPRVGKLRAEIVVCDRRRTLYVESSANGDNKPQNEEKRSFSTLL